MEEKQNVDRKKMCLEVHKSLGHLQLGTSIKNYLDPMSLIDESEGEVQAYSTPDGSITFILDDDGETIMSIQTTESMVYKDEEMIGSNIDAITVLVGEEPSDIDGPDPSGDEYSWVYCFDSIGIMLWVNGEKIVTSGSCSIDFPEDD